MENGTMKSKLLDLLHHAHADIVALGNEVSEQERNASGTFERWSARDLIAHIAHWQDQLTQNLAAARRGEQGPAAVEEDETNKMVFEKNRTRAFDDITAWAERVYAALVAQVNEFNDAELTDPHAQSFYANRSHKDSIIGNSFTHSETHLANYYVQHGRPGRARELQEKVAEALIRFDSSPRSRALALYNLACFCALDGEKHRAIELLREALPLREDLIEWSKQDSDLDSLRELPEYQALYVRT
jgi:hypothetical protein